MSTYPSFAVAFLAEEAAGAATPVTLFDGGRVRHLQHFDLVAEDVGGLGRYVPRPRRRPVARTVDLAATVRHERPRRFPLLRERLHLVLETDHSKRTRCIIQLLWASSRPFRHYLSLSGVPVVSYYCLIIFYSIAILEIEPSENTTAETHGHYSFWNQQSADDKANGHELMSKHANLTPTKSWINHSRLL